MDRHTLSPRPGEDHQATEPLKPDDRAGNASPLGRVIKWGVVAVGLAITTPLALTCWLERRVHRRDEFFLFWGQALALVPGLPGKFLRKAYYFHTLCSCSIDLDIGFMSSFHDARASVAGRVSIGSSVSLGLVHLGEGVQVGSRTSFLSGKGQHSYDVGNRLTPFDRSTANPVQVGSETWIGEAAIVMSHVGTRCIVGAGSVVSRPVPDNCVVAGVPARFIRHTIPDAGLVGDGTP